MTLRRQTGQTHVTARLRPRPVGGRDAARPSIRLSPLHCDLTPWVVVLDCVCYGGSSTILS